MRYGMCTDIATKTRGEVEYKLLGQDLMITGLVRKEDA